MGDNNDYFIMLVHGPVFESMEVIFVRGKKSLNDLSVTVSSAPPVHGNLSELHHLISPMPLCSYFMGIHNDPVTR